MMVPPIVYAGCGDRVLNLPAACAHSLSYRPDNRYAPFSQACRRGCTLTDTSPDCAAGSTTTGVSEEYEPIELRGVTEIFVNPSRALPRAFPKLHKKKRNSIPIEQEVH